MVINNNNNIFEKFSLTLLFIMGFISGYFGYIFIIKGVIVFLFFTLLILSKDFRKAIKDNWIILVLIVILCLLLMINIILADSNTYLLYNLSAIFINILIPYLLLLIYNENNNIYEKFLKNKFKIINIFWIINIIVLFFQIQGTGLFIKSEWFNTNPSYFDHCSGLFGASGTHLLTFFSSFVMVYNFYYAEKIKSIIKKNILIIYNIITIIIMCILSTYNDNDSIFVMYTLFICYLFFVKLSFTKSISKKMLTIICIVSISLLLSFLIYNISSFNNYFKFDLLEKINSVYAPSINSKGSSERLLIFYKAISSYEGSKLGIGIGTYKLIEQQAFGFTHFGISSIGIITTLCGIWIYLLITLVFSKIYTCIKVNKFFFFIYNFILISMLSIYTQLFSNTIEIFWLSISIFMLNSFNKRGKENENS